MSPLLISFLLALLIFLGITALQNYPVLYKHVGLIKNIFKAAKITVEFWGWKRNHSTSLELGERVLGYVTSKPEFPEDMRELRKDIFSFIRQQQDILYPEMSEEEKNQLARSAVSGYIVLINHKEIRETIDSLKDHQSLDVKKATLLAIDIVGEWLDLKDDLTQLYFQHLIYGINKTLLLFKDKGTDRRNLKEITATLWRVYKLTKAYKSTQGRKDLTQEEFYEKANSTFDSLFSIFGI